MRRAWILLLVTLVAMLAGCATEKRGPRLLVLGIDGMDPDILERLLAAGRMPNVERLAARGGWTRLGTSMPPQSPVAWSSFITGLTPDGHGIYDFVHRDPESLTPYLSMARPGDAGRIELQRRGRPFWEVLGAAGIPATIFKVPANFPPSESSASGFGLGCHAPAPVTALAGMGTPDMLGTYGTFTFFTEQDYVAPDHLEGGGGALYAEGSLELPGGRVVRTRLQDGHARLRLAGPEIDGETRAAAFDLYVDAANGIAEVDLDGQRQVLRTGEWSAWMRVDYGRRPGSLTAVTGICLFYLKQAQPLQLYVSPVNIDPHNPAMPISTPAGAAAEWAARGGAYYTQGMPDDTKALEAEVFDYADFLAQDSLTTRERRRHLEMALADFDSGFLFFYVHSLDQLSHMLWRAADADHPGYRPEFAPYADAIDRRYVEVDGLVGQALDALGPRDELVVISDHGFAPYARSVHLNTWLWQEGFLELQATDPAQASILRAGDVDWRRSRAYAVGLNSLYLNQWGREDQGIVEEMDRASVLDDLEARLRAWRDPETGHAVVAEVYRTAPADSIGVRRAPDLLVGYARGYRCSGKSAVGQLTADVIENNRSAWSGDHCMAAHLVPGVLVSSRPLTAGPHGLRDIPVSILAHFGVSVPAAMSGAPAWGVPTIEERN